MWIIHGRLFVRAEYRGIIYDSPTFNLNALNSLDRYTHRAEPAIGFAYKFQDWPMLPVVVLILLCQAGMSHSAAATDIPDPQDYSEAAQSAYQERELMQRYNELARALNGFVAAYKAGQIDVKKARAVRKALHIWRRWNGSSLSTPLEALQRILRIEGARSTGFLVS